MTSQTFDALIDELTVRTKTVLQREAREEHGPIGIRLRVLELGKLMMSVSKGCRSNELYVFWGQITVLHVSKGEVQKFSPEHLDEVLQVLRTHMVLGDLAGL